MPRNNTLKHILRIAALPFVCFAWITPALAVDSAAFDTAVFDVQVEAMLKDWDQPGLAVAIVENNHVIHERGFGVRRIEGKQPVDAQTLFGIASLSKSFAAATVARLVGEGRLAWDAPVTRYLPDFRMPRERDTDEVTLRDLLTMRSGIGSSEYTFRRVSRDRQDHVRRIRFLPQVHPLRSEFLYTTDSYTALGEVIATVTGEPWDRYAAETLWKPLGMLRTDADYRVARADANAASPHITENGRKRTIDWVYEDDAALPAGGVNSSAHDMALWLLFQLNEGRIGGKSLLSAEALHETHNAQTPMRGPFAGSAWATVAGDGEDRLRYRSYAMGWFVHDYRGHMVLSHSGGIDGFRSQIAFLPEDGIGIVALANSDESLMPLAVLQIAMDQALGVADRQWNRRFHERARQQRADADAKLQAVEAARIPGTQPSLALDRYAGTFADNGAFGETRVSLEKGRLVITAGRMRYDLEHWHYDVFKARPQWPYEVPERDFFVEFRLDPQGRIRGFHFSSGYDFQRTPNVP